MSHTAYHNKKLILFNPQVRMQDHLPIFFLCWHVLGKHSATELYLQLWTQPYHECHVWADSSSATQWNDVNVRYLIDRLRFLSNYSHSERLILLILPSPVLVASEKLKSTINIWYVHNVISNSKILIRLKFMCREEWANTGQGDEEQDELDDR
jgi:hypothetical protein